MNLLIKWIIWYVILGVGILVVFVYFDFLGFKEFVLLFFCSWMFVFIILVCIFVIVIIYLVDFREKIIVFLDINDSKNEIIECYIEFVRNMFFKKDEEWRKRI